MRASVLQPAGRVQLTEAVAVGRPAPCEVPADSCAEDPEQDEGADRSVRCGLRREEEARDRELCEWKRSRHRAREPPGHPEVDDGRTGSLSIAELCDGGHREDHSKDDTGGNCEGGDHYPSSQRPLMQMSPLRQPSGQQLGSLAGQHPLVLCVPVLVRTFPGGQQ